MSILSELTYNKGSQSKRHRVGRGDASGSGGTSGKGHKGQKARAGGNIRRGFEGGQMPLIQRLPKFGFTNHRFKTTYNVINLEQLNQFDSEVTIETLKKKGLVKRNLPVKILGSGTLEKALKVHAHKFSASAQKAITDKGGSIEVISS